MSNELIISSSSSLTYNIFSINGNITISSLVPVTGTLNIQISSGAAKDLVLDLSDVEYIDSSGIRLFLNIKKKIESKNRKFYLLKPSEAVVAILKETNLDKIIKILDSSETLEKQASNDIFNTYYPYTRDDNGLRRLNCSCPICGSKEVTGYLLNQNTYDWKWINDDPFPLAYESDKNIQFNYFGLLPIICTECYMSSIRLSDFNIISDDKVAIKSKLHDVSKDLLIKSIKKRKKMMDINITIGDNYFQNPRESNSIFKAYELAEFCIRSISVSKTDATPFEVGFLSYLCIQYANKKEKDTFINNCRTWFTQALMNPNELTISEQIISHFILLISNLNLDKKKEASDSYTAFSEYMNSISQKTIDSGLSSPSFWYNQGEVIWKKYIEEQSKSFM